MLSAALLGAAAAVACATFCYFALSILQQPAKSAAEQFALLTAE
jgi:hypothetical protein